MVFISIGNRVILNCILYSYTKILNYDRKSLLINKLEDQSNNKKRYRS